MGEMPLDAPPAEPVKVDEVFCENGLESNIVDGGFEL
jgi:hypothetical protein